MNVLPRYSPLAWIAAVAVSVCAWAETFKYDAVTNTAFWISVFAVVGWVLVRWTGWFVRRVPAGDLREPAMLRAVAWLGFALFALCMVFGFAWAFAAVYPDPAVMRAYAETLGIDLAPFFLGTLAVGVAVVLLSATAIRALARTEPRSAWPVRLVFVAAPVGWIAFGAILLTVVGEFKVAWADFGADLPTPTLFFLDSNAHLGIAAAAAIAFAGLAWFQRADALAFRRVATVQIMLLLLFSTCFTLAVIAAVLPLIKTCGAV